MFDYKPSATGLAFHQDVTSKVKFIKGPVAAGKTSIALLDTFFIARRQRPDKNGERKTKWAIVRSTYGELKSTVIKTFNNWLGAMCTVVYDTPIRAHLRQPMPDGTILDIEYLFIALDGDNAVNKLRSLEVTGVLFSEVSETDFSIVEMAITRLRGYPKKELDPETGLPDPRSGPTWSGIIMESNPPPMNHWLYRMFEITRPPGYTLYTQPAPLEWDEDAQEFVQSPDAENLEFIENGIEYYYRIMAESRTSFSDVYVLGKYGVSFSGKPCWPRFEQRVHSSPTPLVPMVGPPLIIGVDPGLSGALVVTQMSSHGGILCYDEILFDDDILQDVIIERLRPLLANKYRNFRVQVVTDPWGKARSALSSATTIDMFKQAGLAAIPAVTNDIEPRLEAVNFFLNRSGGFLLDPAGCPTLAEAMQGGYRFKKRKENDVHSTYKDTPEKDKFSGPADALQYASLFHQKGQHLKRAKPVARTKKFLYA